MIQDTQEWDETKREEGGEGRVNPKCKIKYRAKLNNEEFGIVYLCMWASDAKMTCRSEVNWF